MTARVAILASALLGAIASAQATVSTVLTSPPFSYCLAANECSPSCIESQFGLDYCSVSCVPEPSGDQCFAHANGQWSLFETWENSNTVGHFPPPGGDLTLGFVQHTFGKRIPPDLFTLEHQVVESLLPSDPVSGNVGVFRFAGDPSVFDGIEVASIAELIDLGLIEPTDVLLSESFIATDGFTRNYEVDVTGVPNEEIVVFGALTQDRLGAVPGLTAWGRIALLTLALTGLTVASVRWRRRSAA